MSELMYISAGVIGNGKGKEKKNLKQGKPFY